MMKRMLCAAVVATLLMTLGICTVSQAVETGTVVYTDYQFDIVYSAPLSPFKVRIDNNDQVYAINNCGDTVYQIHENGELTIRFTRADMVIGCFDFDSENNLWLTTGKKELYKLDADGNLQLIVPYGVNRAFYIDSKNNIIAVDDYSYGQSVQLISPDGDITVLADDIDVSYHMVGINDEIVVLTYQGQLIRIDPSGEQTVIADTGMIDAGLAVAPDGTAYIIDSNLHTVDLDTGELQAIDWYSIDIRYPCFDSLGRLYVYHPNEGIYRLDLQRRTIEPFYMPNNNTMAMAVTSTGDLYVAYGDKLPNGTTTIYQIVGGKLVAVKTVPGGEPRGMAVQGQDTLYIATSDTAAASYIYTVNLVSNKYKKLAETFRGLSTLVVSPTDDSLWWGLHNGRIYKRTAGGSVISVSEVCNKEGVFFDFSTDGTLYAILWAQRETRSDPGPHSLYKLGADGEWIELADMTTQDPAITWALPVVGLDGSVYAIASIDGSTISPTRTGSSFDAVLLYNGEGGFSLIGYDFPFDCCSAACDPTTGDIYFANSAGVYRFTPPQERN